ncbi:leucine-rich repeat protein [Perkinsela sp. CCAP 1560/4]|nr:leucine-rich repeat protein [Perkinsela sp. CCAP 1560/4]|eukprot:KNH08111.1 leucine-rich repeat protein [Perkinsela sp. CCAP 1560/4]
MRFALVFLDAADPSLGRVDLESLPQQALMEMVIEGITNKEQICGDANEPKDIEEWEGVGIEDGQVVEIFWQRFDLKGELHFEWLPSSVREFHAFKNGLTGTLDLASFPTSMKELSLGLNALIGSIILERFPKNMEVFRVFQNQLSGPLKLESLPDTLTDFIAGYNQFTGSVNLTQLPAALSFLDLENNRLSANPTKGHLSVVGWTSTQPLGRFGKPPNYFQGNNLLGGETREDIY